MASQSAMIEIVSGSESSESIINIPQSQSSGASSISTVSSSTTNATIVKLHTEIEKLREDKKGLEGRLRGLKTLSALTAQYQKENQNLKVQLAIALGKQPTETMSSSENNSSVRSPFSLVSNQAMQNLPQTERNNLSSVNVQVKNKTNATLTANKEPAIAHPPVNGPPSSMQETSGPPSELEETKLVSLTTPTGRGTKPAWMPRDTSPKQESLGQLSTHSSPELLQYDSDKYDEATYDKVAMQLGRGVGRNSSMYGAGREDNRPTDFPSLSSGLSNGMPQPPSHTSSTRPPYMAMMHQSQMSEHLNSGLAAEVENITERLNSDPADSTAAIAIQMHQIAERISKVENKERDQKKLIDTLMRENQDLKKQVKITETSHQQGIVALREQNTRLMQQLKGSRHRADETTVVKLSGSQSDWVHVERPLQLCDSFAGSDNSLVDRIRKLEQEKAELQRANSNWKTQWDKMEQKHQLQLSELRSQLTRFEQDVANHKAHLLEQTSEFESRMLELKKRMHEEESQKEDAVHQQLLSERKCSELQAQLTELGTQLSDTARDRQALAAELSILKAQVSASGQEMQTSKVGSASTAAHKAEIAMLKEQLKVFAEDFEHEREDRTMAQSARDAAKKNAESMAKQNQQLSSQIRHLQKQIKDRDDTISWTLRQNETLQQQLSDFKKKASSEWTEKQNLQRVLSLMQQQQLQRSRFAMPQNPYTFDPPSRSYQLPQSTQPSPNWQPSPQNRSPEHLPGAWTCTSCTYINYPGRTVCESCGFVNSPTRSYPEHNGYSSQDPYGSEHALLMSRGNDQRPTNSGANGGDLVIDSEIWHPPTVY